MSMASHTATARRPGKGRSEIAREIARFIDEFRRILFDHYQPERHYMRGPGPKWRERHGDS